MLSASEWLSGELFWEPNEKFEIRVHTVFAPMIKVVRTVHRIKLSDILTFTSQNGKFAA